jgi:hypothetical protein
VREQADQGRDRSARRSVDRNRLTALGTFVFLVGLGSAAWADTYLGGMVGTNGSDAHGPVAVSDTGRARGEPICDGICVTGQEGVLAVSGTGTATGGIAASGTGPATATSPGWGIPAVAVSGTQCATAVTDYSATSIAVSGTGCSTAGTTNFGGNSIALSGLGCSTATTDDNWYGIGLAVSPVCGASGMWAVTGTGDAYSTGTETAQFVSLPVPGLAISGTGNATGGWLAIAPDGNAHAVSSTGTAFILGPPGVPVPFRGIGISGSGHAVGDQAAVAGQSATSSGGIVALGGLGNATGSVVAVSGSGNAQGSGIAVALGGGDADAGGGVLSVSGQGRARGGLVNYGWDGAG